MTASAIASLRNPLIKEIRRALSKGTLTEGGFAVAESFHLLEEALRSDCEVHSVLAAEGVQSAVQRHIRNLQGVRLHVASPEVFDSISTTENSQGVVALVRPPQSTLDHLLRGRTLLVVLDGVQDPGNAGTIVRSAEAFGSTGVLFLKGSVSPYNSKTLRASAGSLFRLPAVSGIDAELARAALQQARLDVYTAMPGSARQLQDIDFRRKCAIVIGNEGQGVSRRMQDIASDLAIPTSGVESLNAAIAASIILYEASRQRRATA
ncbi:MAG: RNA methyltransferase [Bryobacterales bacterium]|nr:RNA methyltransferase [Bryobacterales bacterium]